MFNPNQISNLREILKTEDAVFRFDGHPCRTIPVQTAPTAFAVARSTTSKEEVEFYGPENIFGTPHNPDCLTGIGNGVFEPLAPILYSVEQARIIGNQAVIDQHSHLYRPALFASSTDQDQLLSEDGLDHEGFLLHSQGGTLSATFASLEEPRHFKHSALFLHNLEPGNYGSFIFRLLPQIMFAAEFGIEFTAYVTPERTPWFLEALRLLELPERPVFTVQEVCGDFFQKVYLSTELSSEGLFSQSTRRGFIDLVERATTSCASNLAACKLYVSRSLASSARPWYRMLRNESALEAFASRSGFTIVHPETLTFRQQVLAFGSARRIVGPSGSGMLNAVFADDKVKVLDMESFTMNVRQHAKIYASTKKVYSFLFGELARDDESHPIVRPWNVREELFRSGIDWLDG